MKTPFKAPKEIRNRYPKIEMFDALENRSITTTAIDEKVAHPRDYSGCVASVAAVRQYNLLDAYTSRSAIYFIWNKLKCEKYELSKSLREAISEYDENGKFKLSTFPIYAPSLAPKGTQIWTVLTMLRDARDKGVRRDIFINDYQIFQIGARVDELIKKGYDIVAKKARPCDRFVTYYLISEPAIPLAAPKKRSIKKHIIVKQGDKVRSPFGRKLGAA